MIRISFACLTALLTTTYTPHAASSVFDTLPNETSASKITDNIQFSLIRSRLAAWHDAVGHTFPSDHFYNVMEQEIVDNFNALVRTLGEASNSPEARVTALKKSAEFAITQELRLWRMHTAQETARAIDKAAYHYNICSLRLILDVTQTEGDFSAESRSYLTALKILNDRLTDPHLFLVAIQMLSDDDIDEHGRIIFEEVKEHGLISLTKEVTEAHIKALIRKLRTLD
jgi:hypothetical protein